MPAGNYKKPPITEAVIQVDFSREASRDQLEKCMRVFKTTYPNHEELYEVSVKFEGPSPLTTDQKFSGIKATGEDQVDVLMLGPSKIATVRLAPYQGWDGFFERAKSNFKTMKSKIGPRTIRRVATRYVNRIDIPRDGREIIEVNDYVKVEPRTPESIPVLNLFWTQFIGSVNNSPYRVLINSGTTPSPLIDHCSFTLDIDLYLDQGLPQQDDDLWAVLVDLRRQKDEIFEAFLTDQARELFDRA